MQPHTLDVAESTCALIKRYAETRLHELVARSTIMRREWPQLEHLVSNDRHCMHNCVGQHIARLGHQLELVLNQAEVRHPLVHWHEWKGVSRDAAA